MLEGSFYKSPEWNPKQWVSGAWVGVGTSGVGYTSSYGYDPNGNITNLTRKDRGGVSFDNLSYTYTDPTLPVSERPYTNRLDHITDGVSNNTQTYDLKTQSEVNYTYDQIGNLTSDNTEGISSITWNASGKVNKVVKPTVETSFLYDGMGNRVRKFVDKTGTTNDVNTYYVRDASGNVMSTYEKIGANGDIKQIEAPIYGSDRLGMEKPNNLIRYNDINNDLVSTTEKMFKRTLGLKQYELKDHLGNVRVVLGDSKIRTGTGATYPFKPEVVSYSNYYPFGMQMQENNQMAPGGDTWQNAITGYRYGYNGKEEDNELHGDGNSYDYGARMYDPRLGRWLGIDRLASKYPDVSPFCYTINNPIQFKDPDGNDIYVTTIDPKQFDLIKDAMIKTQTGMLVWSAYAKNGSRAMSEDIFINVQKFSSWSKKFTLYFGNGIFQNLCAGIAGVVMNPSREYYGWTMKDKILKQFSIINSSGVVTFTPQHYDKIYDLADLNSFHGLNVSSSINLGKKVDLISLNSTSFTKPISDVTVDDIMDAAMRLYHEMYSHVYISVTGGQNGEHDAFWGKTREYDREANVNLDPLSPAGIYWQQLQSIKADIAKSLQKLQNDTQQEQQQLYGPPKPPTSTTKTY